MSGPVLDVRQQSEYTEGHLPGATDIELGELPERAAGESATAPTVMCAHGERAVTAATVLARAGRRDLTVVFGGGATEWAAVTGGTLVEGT